MTRDDIIKMAKEAGLPTAWISESELTLFAAFVAAAEREECAKVCESLEAPERYEGAWTAGWYDATDDCAVAIRARGET